MKANLATLLLLAITCNALRGQEKQILVDSAIHRHQGVGESGFTLTRKDTYLYNTTGRVTQHTRYSWDQQLSSWVGYLKMENLYDAN